MSAERLDLIIAGAGPAGSSCAERAASLGLSVIVFERAVFPRSKPCAAGLSSAALTSLGEDVGEIVHRSFDEVELVLGARMRAVWHGAQTIVATTTRRELDAHLVERARRAGATIEFGTPVDSFRDCGTEVEVTAGGAALGARYLVSADGACGCLRRMAGLETLELSGAAYVRAFPPEGRVADQAFSRPVVDATAKRCGYGWIFPKRDHLNVGVCGQERLGPEYVEDVRRFLRAYRLDGWRTEGPFARPVPCEASAEGATRGRLLTVGDAAGLADPVSGEGIPHAITSGRLAAEAIAAAPDGAAGERYAGSIAETVLPRVNLLRPLGSLLHRVGPRAVERTVSFAPAARLIERWVRGSRYTGAGYLTIERRDG